ncbi:MAG: hypothetical protein Ta2E_00110 [Mycoplasmoidaceae bacterium]|nr:MAG: hypothetical protein Ta2E_00110 [Mycoplasmoidaceae bacterium]
MKCLNKQSRFLEKGKVTALHPDYHFSNAGFMLYVGNIGSGKAYEVLKHLLTCDNLGENSTGLWFKIGYACSIGDDDETSSTFKKAPKTPIIKVLPN